MGEAATFGATSSYDAERGVCVVAVRGELDAATADRLKAEVIRSAQAHGSPVVLDARGVKFIDAAGVGALVGASTVARKLGCPLTVRNPSPPVLRLLRLAGLERSLLPDGDGDNRQGNSQ
ncbi:STAS domain-containing protein [Acidiferrimicrobium sp. IK]|uniref:STAS domain-containing protein n=1 Tax=Acidiferrimicrobium sp. IK TaxID=2871700 RepID=UPI0021CAE3DE|nr:STAS domain-containing protein [Acidiferrimicrobium sp. IK]MCU4183281.1 STAS domain-containing protein [Acidiferrimicrobium sp. IK]